MNTLREALQSYLDMRHSLGFKMQKASTALVDFLSFLSNIMHATSRSHWRLNGHNCQQILNHLTGPTGCAAFVDSRGIAAPRTHARKSRFRDFCPSEQSARGHFCIPRRIFAIYFELLCR